MSDLNVTNYATKNNNLRLRVAEGHFATCNAHSTHYIDVVSLKACLSEAKAVAEELCSNYYYDTLVDTVLCLDGMEVIGACLANTFVKSGFVNMNENKSVYVVTPETTSGSQLLFRDNIVPMITGKNVLILAVSVSSGKTVESAIEAVNYYGGKVSAISAIFSTAKECHGLPIHSVFDPNDLPDYHCYPAHECPMCKEGKKLDALINSHGFSKL